ncbi:MAG: soluble lytic murein transglycosylase-like protein [Planctomycetota bacterium]|jgi:soluble lytic murein transglycosylase-like protein
MGLPKAGRRRAVFALVLGIGLVLVGLAGLWRRGPVAPIVAAVRDQLGIRLVEGQAEHLLLAAEESGVDVYLLAGIMYSESRGVSGQTSSAGALGLMQLGLAAASDAALRLGIDEVPTKEALLHEDRLNVRLAGSHLRWLLQHAGEWDLEAVLVSYNAGRAKLMRWIDEQGSYADWCLSEERALADGRPNTGALHYARQCLAAAERFRERAIISP